MCLWRWYSPPTSARCHHDELSNPPTCGTGCDVTPSFGNVFTFGKEYGLWFDIVQIYIIIFLQRACGVGWGWGGCCGCCGGMLQKFCSIISHWQHHKTWHVDPLLTQVDVGEYRFELICIYSTEIRNVTSRRLSLSWSLMASPLRSGNTYKAIWSCTKHDKYEYIVTTKLCFTA